MSGYHIDLSKTPNGHSVPPLLASFADWLATQDHGSVGYFDALKIGPVGEGWDEPTKNTLQAAGYCFLNLPDGSELALIDTGRPGAPHAVILLGSEGDKHTVANSLEEFLAKLSTAETGISELDDEEAGGGREALAAWLVQKSVTAPETPDFTFETWLDGASGYEEPNANVPAPHVPKLDPSLPPMFRRLAEMLGRRADDPGLIAYVTNELGAKVPGPCAEGASSKEVISKKVGLSLWFGVDTNHESMPKVRRTANTLVRYFSEVALEKEWAETLPFGLDWNCTDKELSERVGPAIEITLPRNRGVRRHWEREIDPGRSYLQIDWKESRGLTLTLRIHSS